MRTGPKAAGVIAATLAVGVTAAISATPAIAHRHEQVRHVLLISVDGMHQSDLEWYVAHHPNSELAKLAGGGARVHRRPHVGPV